MTLYHCKVFLNNLGKVPWNGNKANIMLVFNKGKLENPGSYRLVSLTSVPGKVMNQVILESIFKHRKDKKVTGSSHQVFMEVKSCLTGWRAFPDEVIGLTDKELVLSLARLFTLSLIRQADEVWAS